MGTTVIALIAVTDNESPFAAGAQRPGTYYVDLGERAELLPPTEAQIKSLREAGADLIVLSAHLGPNMVDHPSKRIGRYVAQATDRGVDLVHGHSAHVFQGIERRGSSLILHDAGDFLDDYAVDAELRNDWSFVFRLEVTARGISRLQLLPVRLEFAHVRLATGVEKREICERMRKLSAELGTTLSPIEEGLELDLSSV
jgi:poly-gamma-glutamate capsule biosynthesis protein CapA/YwtB (metallophosphatase superfamily)